MLFWKCTLLVLVTILINISAFAQQDSIKTDSTLIYRNIESFSNRRKFTGFIHSLIFRSDHSDSINRQGKRRNYRKPVQKPYSSLEGKIIRNINVVTLDPFGYSASDTAAGKLNFFSRAGNGAHIKTHGITIRNLLLFRKDQPFSSILVKESERLVRLQNFVHEVTFSVVLAGVNSDSVDINIRELDKWSIIPEGSISASGITTALTDKNFLGSGHEFQNLFSRNFKNGINSFNTDYSVPNVRNSYISAKLHLGIDGYGNFSRSIAVDRPFFSPLAKWAAGISLESQIKKDSLKDIDQFYMPVSLKFNTQDYWAGKSLRLFKGIARDDRVINLILAGRYLRIQYLERPPEVYDPLHLHSSESFFLTTIGISTRKYVQDNYIFKYGVIEDVPVGNVYSLTTGYQTKNSIGRLYMGLKLYTGNYYEWGYLSSNFEYGTFLKDSHTEQGVITVGVNYFTELIEIGKWKLRQFIKPQMTIGINRITTDSLSLNDRYGLDGFNSPVLSGTNRLLFSFQTQSYAPWNIFGFRPGPYFTYSIGMLSDANTGFRKSKIYSQIGLGVLIKNENLVFKTFQISISFYPLIPGTGINVLKLNAYRSSDFGFRDFEITKPAMMIYQ